MSAVTTSQQDRSPAAPPADQPFRTSAAARAELRAAAIAAAAAPGGVEEPDDEATPDQRLPSYPELRATLRTRRIRVVDTTSG